MTGPSSSASTSPSRQLRDEQLPARVQDAIAAHQLTAGRLVLEITETTLIADLAAAATMLDRLHALGARIALDDFGTGYSSLSYLDALPVRLVKTDRSFIEKVTDAHTVPPLVAAIANLCTTLGLTGVAEGIGTDPAIRRRPQPRIPARTGIPARRTPTRQPPHHPATHRYSTETRATCPEPRARTNAREPAGHTFRPAPITTEMV